MKKIIFQIIFLTALGFCGLAVAQNSTNKTAVRQTIIDSASADFDLNGGLAVYYGHVVVTDPQMKLECDRLVVFIPKQGERLNRIEAQTNVVIHFSDNHGANATATGALAVYRYVVQAGQTNETVTLTGYPQVESEQGTLTGDAITWDRANNKLSATNQRMKLKQDLNQSLGTNSAR
jgi:lipopolysaccharide transport protein LptA